MALNNNWVIEVNENCFEFRNRKQRTRVLPWGDDVLRIVSTAHHAPLEETHHSIQELGKMPTKSFNVNKVGDNYYIINNDLTAEFNGKKLSFFNKGELVLKEFHRGQSHVRRTIGIDEDEPILYKPSSSLNINPHEFKSISFNKKSAILRFEGDKEEKIYGLGGYQEQCFNKNLGSYELMHRNSQTSIPFYISNKNYGFIWNNASIGSVTFSSNEIKWVANNSEVIDYFVIVGEKPSDIHRKYMEIVGRPPMIDSDLLGLWQSKLRYQNLSELEQVYRDYKKRDIPLSVLVIDYFHWTEEGNFEFDLDYWKGINKFAEVAKKNKTYLMVSVWPTVSKKSKYYELYQNEQMVLKNNAYNDVIFNEAEILDFSNPKTISFIKKLIKENYQNIGIRLFWADQAEPEMSHYNHSNFDSYYGNFEKTALQYPYYYTKALSFNATEFVNPLLVRSAWFNSQKYGALAWSGDIDSSFKSLQCQIQIGLSMGIVGIPWWTSDIGGFHSGDSSSNEFKELLIRWFQFATFSPILRMHGDRQPHTQKQSNQGGGLKTSGSENEIWSFGSKVEQICTRFIKIRENIRPYLVDVYYEAHRIGLPIMRPLFFEYPNEGFDEVINSYMLGSDLLIYPITKAKQEQIEIRLPGKEKWINIFSGKVFEGSEKYQIKITLEEIPVFIKQNSKYIKQIVMKGE